MRLDTDLLVLAVTKYALVLFGSAHWFGCIWWAVARFSGFGDTCWVTQYYRLVGKPIDAATFRSSSYNYLLSLYWGFTVMTATLLEGYAPDNTQETILCVVSTFAQVLVFSFLLGILLHYVRAKPSQAEPLGILYLPVCLPAPTMAHPLPPPSSSAHPQIVKKDANQEKFNTLMDKVERYAKMHDLPRRLESSIKLCFTFQHQKRIGQDEEILVRDSGFCSVFCSLLASSTPPPLPQQLTTTIENAGGHPHDDALPHPRAPLPDGGGQRDLQRLPGALCHLHPGRPPPQDPHPGRHHLQPRRHDPRGALPRRGRGRGTCIS